MKKFFAVAAIVAFCFAVARPAWAQCSNGSCGVSRRVMVFMQQPAPAPKPAPAAAVIQARVYSMRRGQRSTITMRTADGSTVQVSTKAQRPGPARRAERRASRRGC